MENYTYQNSELAWEKFPVCDEIATFPFLMPTLITGTTATASLLQLNFF